MTKNMAREGSIIKPVAIVVAAMLLIFSLVYFKRVDEKASESKTNT